MKNVIVYGVSETEGEDVRSKVEHVLADIGEKPVVRDCSRLGSRKEGAVRSIRFTVGSSDHAAQVHLTRCISRNDGARARKIGRWLGQLPRLSEKPEICAL